MATTTIDARAIAGTLYESLIGTALHQLKTVAPRLASIGGQGVSAQEQINSLLPADTLPQVRNFVLGLANEGLLNQIGAITDAFAGLGQDVAQPLDAEVTSAVALSESQRNTITADLSQRYGSNVAVRFSVDESLIGGLIIRVGDQVLDNSLRARLGVLQRNMLSS